MIALVCLMIAVVVASAVIGTMGRLMVEMLWTLAAFGMLLWLAVTPAPPIIPALRWALGAWLAWVLFGYASRRFLAARS